MNTPHTDADLLRAVADGKQMQRKEWNEWVDCTHETALVRISMGMPTRVKPEPKPDVVRFMVCDEHTGLVTFEMAQDFISRFPGFSGIVRVVIDGETNKVKSTEVVS